MTKILKFAAGIVLVFVVIASAVVGITMQKSGSAINEHVELDFRSFEFVSDATAIAEGQHLFKSRGCADCHADDAGGKLVFEAPPMGRFSGTNLTQLENYKDEDWIRAIRFGLAPDGRKLVFMPAHEFTHYGDSDLNSLVAYIRSLPTVDRVNDPIEIGLLARFLYLKGDFPLLSYEMVDASLADQAAPATGPTAEYGSYLLRGCIGCHGNNLSGGAIPGVPPDWPAAANLTMHDTGLAEWSFEDFDALIETGVRPDGRKISEVMPLSVLQAMYDWERKAIWEGIKAVPTKEFGGR